MVELIFLLGIPVAGFALGTYLVVGAARREAESTGGVVLISTVGIVLVALAAFMLYAAVSYFVAPQTR